MATNIQQVLDGIQDQTVAEAKKQFQDWLAEAKQSSQDFIKECAKQFEQWVIDLSAGEMTLLEFNRLVSAQEILLKQLALRETIEAQKRAQQTALKVLETTVEKVVPAVLAAAI
jgi:hypothetical protein